MAARERGRSEARGEYDEKGTGGLDPWPLKPWQVPVVGDSYEGVRVLRAALSDLVKDYQVIPRDAVWVKVRRRRLTNGHNALQRVSREFGERPAMVSPECDPLLARAVLETAETLERVTERALQGLLNRAVVVQDDDFRDLIRARDLLQIGLDRSNVADRREEASDEGRFERREGAAAS